MWLGGSDAQKEDLWTWTDGTAWEVNYWNQSEPNGRGGENCLAILQGAWTDNNCSKTTLDGFVCRLPSTLTNFWDLARLFSENKMHSKSTEIFFRQLAIQRIKAIRSIKDNKCLTTAEEYEVIGIMRKELSLSKSELTEIFVSDQQLPVLLEAFSLLHFCPPSNVVELLKIANFYWASLTCWGPWSYFCLDTRSLVLATMNNILQNEVLYNMDLVHEFFDEMDKTYNFTLGPAILSLMSESKLRDMAEKNYPFLRNYKSCLQDKKCKINVTKDEQGKVFLAF